MSAAPVRPRRAPGKPDLNLLNLPAPGLLSIFHRISGAVMFLALIPGLLYLLQQTLRSEFEYQYWKGVVTHPFCKLLLIGFFWAYLHHFLAGIRFLLLDMHIGIKKEYAQASAKAIISLGLIGAALFGVWLW